MANALVCTQCGYVGKPKTKTKGSGLIELLLWLCFLIPGIIYSLWRLSSRHQICSQCGSPAIIPVDSPRARKIMEESGASPEKYIEEKKQDVIKHKKRVKQWIWIIGVILFGYFVLIFFLS